MGEIFADDYNLFFCESNSALDKFIDYISLWILIGD